jgi:hypothetical protein
VGKDRIAWDIVAEELIEIERSGIEKMYWTSNTAMRDDFGGGNSKISHI